MGDALSWLQTFTKKHDMRIDQAILDTESPVLFINALCLPDLLATLKRLGNAKLLRKAVAVLSLRQTVNEILGDVS